MGKEGDELLHTFEPLPADPRRDEFAFPEPITGTRLRRLEPLLHRGLRLVAGEWQWLHAFRRRVLLAWSGVFVASQRWLVLMSGYL